MQYKQLLNKQLNNLFILVTKLTEEDEMKMTVCTKEIKNA
jgi:hypothetical protein